MHIRHDEIMPVYVSRGEIWQVDLHGSVGVERKWFRGNKKLTDFIDEVSKRDTG